ncbi:MAG: SDR family oxidoreductase [Isosphaeraceae bacterium]|nr:SDR family oxidoreductase [Isosphaeraceae bacterium]
MSTLIVGCGYLGKRVAQQLVAAGEHVWGTVRSRPRADDLAASLIEPVIADVLDPASLRALPEADRVFYSVGFDRTAGVAMRTVYVDGLRNALERLGDRSARIVYASSTGVYGQDDGSWVEEDALAEPRHESGRTCLEAENLARDWAAARGFPLIVLRFAGLYGPGRIPRRANVERGEPIAGDPSKFVNFIHSDDAATAAVAALVRGKPGAVYHVADDRPVTRAEFYGRLAECLDAPPPRFSQPAPGSAEARREESNKRVANRRLRDELGVDLHFPDVIQGLGSALKNHP